MTCATGGRNWSGPRSWAVTVAVDGEDILTLSSTGLCGLENIQDYADVIRNCGEHLLAFIGPADVEPFIVDDARGCGEQGNVSE